MKNKEIQWLPFTIDLIQEILDLNNKLTMLDVRIFLYLVLNMDDNNKIEFIQKELANTNELQGVSEANISKSIKKLRELDFISKTLIPHEVMVNPNMTYLGGKRGKEKLLIYYEDVKKQLKKKKKKKK